MKWIQLSNGNGNGTLPKDLLTKDEVGAQIAAAKNPRDKALISMLYETGARIGELIDLTVGDIEDRKHGKKVVINGKTGSRRLPLVESVPHINNWLNKHPNPEKAAPLWCKIQQGAADEPLGYRYIREKILKKNMERAEVDKPSNPHHYRHSRASYLANEMTEANSVPWQAELRYRRTYAKLDERGRRPHPNSDQVPSVPDRPKGMHHSTYEDLVGELTQARLEWKGAWMKQLRHMTRDLEHV